ncbi:helix-turn-helix domain-containing protein [Edaphobacter sp.]|uniref:helix-turn-helix domain-containing protein n=1 Tax=Edaphobacter sp. TaxID=1934404 RepID=UPI0039C86EDA
MLDAARLVAIRKRLALSQEQMARLLNVSFVTVNRWEGGHSGPTGSTLDLYTAIDVAIRAGQSPEAITRAASGERGSFLYTLFRMAYAHSGGKSR